MVLTQTEKIVLICAAIFWQIFSIITFIVVNKNTAKQYRKFYPHPIVGLAKDIQHDGRFNGFEILFIRTVLTIAYLPITVEWFVGWCLYKFWKSIYVDDTQLSVEEETEIESMTIEVIKKECNDDMLKDYLEAMNNPEYISKEEKEEQALMSGEYMDFLYRQKNESMSSDNDKELTPLMEETPITILKDEKESKTKRKYTPRKKKEVTEEVKKDNVESENN